MAWEDADCSRSGATTQTSSPANAAASACEPGGVDAVVVREEDAHRENVPTARRPCYSAGWARAAVSASASVRAERTASGGRSLSTCRTTASMVPDRSASSRGRAR